MLTSALLLDTPQFRVRDVVCAHGRGSWAPVETSTRSAIVFSRHGAFRRRGRFGEEVIDPGVAYFQRAGEEQEFAHPHHGGDRCTAVSIEPPLLAGLLGGDPALPVATPPRIDLDHRFLERDPSEERVLSLVACILAMVAPRRVASGRPSTARARRQAASATREALAADPSLSLLALARLTAVSPHHLSRVFRE